MTVRLRRWVSKPHMRRGGGGLVLLIVVAAVVELAAGTGLAYAAGFSRVRAVLGDFRWPWLVVLAGALVISLAGYYLAYQGIFRVDGGRALPRRQMRAVVAAGFGGLLAHGRGALDQYALEAAGAGQRDAKARAASLAGLEQGMLAIVGCAAAIIVLAGGFARPPESVTLPWAVLPVPGLLIAFWAAERYRDRFRAQPGWRGMVGTFLESIHLIRELCIRPRRWALALAGMALFWAAEALAAWAALAAFGVRMNAAALMVGFGTGMVYTRRTGPLGGAGILVLMLPPALWSSGAPLAAAIAGVFAYRVLSLWLPIPIALAVLPTLRTMSENKIAQDASTTEPSGPLPLLTPQPQPSPAGPG